MLNGKSIDEINIGDKASITRAFTDDDVIKFAELSRDYTAYHLDDEVARQSIFGARIVHGLLIASLVPAICSSLLPGPGTIGIDLYVKLLAPVYIGEPVTARAEVVEKDAAHHRVRLELSFVNQHGKEVLIGHTSCIAPRRQFEHPG